jgi:hypothetical protein
VEALGNIRIMEQKNIRKDKRRTMLTAYNLQDKSKKRKRS